MKKSKWFDGAKFVPAHVGVYETNHNQCDETTYQYWDGKKWCYYAPNVHIANGYREFRSMVQSPTWRGIKK